MKLPTYLNYGGNCAQAFRFYEKHLGGRITIMMTHSEQPNAKDISPNQKDAILYTDRDPFSALPSAGTGPAG
jgi:PhnB protein